MRRTVANPEVLGGKPIVEGTLLSVDHILGWLGHRMSHAEIVAEITTALATSSFAGGSGGVKRPNSMCWHPPAVSTAMMARTFSPAGRAMLV